METQIVQTFRAKNCKFSDRKKLLFKVVDTIGVYTHSIYYFQSRFCHILEKLDINYQQNGSDCHDAFKIMW